MNDGLRYVWVQVDALPRRMHAGGDGGGGYSSGMASVLPTAVLPTRMFPSGGGGGGGRGGRRGLAPRSLEL